MYTDKSQKKINILYIIDTFCGHGGTENHLHYLCKYMNRDRFNCSIVSFNIWGSFVEKVRESGTKVYHLPVARYYTPGAFMKSFQLQKIIKENKIDIVQTFHYKSDTYGVVTAKLAGVKHIISSRRDVGDYKSKHHFIVHRLCNRFVDRYIAVCKEVGKRMSINEGIPESKLTIIYNGVNLESFTVPDSEFAERERKKLGIEEHDFVVGSVANFRPEKNYDIFFQAVLKARSKIKNLKAVVVGQGPQLERSKQYCKKNNMSGMVVFTGPVTDVRKYIATMDVACLVPGSNEGFSNSILEKMAMGKPMIVTPVGGNAEAVTDGENGVVVPMLDPIKLAEAMVYLYNDPKGREEMGRKNREKIENKFDLKNMIRNHENFYEKVCN